MAVNQHTTKKALRRAVAHSGFGIVEAIVAGAVLIVALTSVLAALSVSLHTVKETTRKTQAVFLLEETLEAVKHIRDQSWNVHIAPLTVSTEYYLDFAGGRWGVTTVNIPIGGAFTRSFRLENTLRDGNDDIASSGTLDPDTKKLIATVTWGGSVGITSLSATTYITDLFDD